MNLFSFEFGLAFFIFWTLYYLFKFSLKVQKWLILAFSYIFLFSFDYKILLINIFFSLFVYCFSLLIFYLRTKISLWISLAFIILTLSFFKYHWFLEILFTNNYLGEFSFILTSDIALPLGLSFYSFMSISYLVGVYKKELNPPPLLDLLIYLSFFATIISGPILRAKSFFVSLNSPKKFDQSDYVFALLSISIIKKLLIANYLYTLINPIFSSPEIYPSHTLVAALFGYTVMIYADFSGYVDFVRAMGAMCGFRLDKNFDKPFEAENLREFWRRWHITLMNFIKEHIYIPLGGSKCPFWRKQLNVMIVFLISGIWHGGGLGFLVWGLVHGVGICFLNLLRGVDLLKFALLKRFVTFSFVSFAWVFFTKDLQWSLEYLRAIYMNLNGHIYLVFGVILAAALYIIVQPKLENYEVLQRFYSRFSLFGVSVILVVFGIGVYFIMPEGMPEFIYQGF